MRSEVPAGSSEDQCKYQPRFPWTRLTLAIVAGMFITSSLALYPAESRAHPFLAPFYHLALLLFRSEAKLYQVFRLAWLAHLLEAAVATRAAQRRQLKTSWVIGWFFLTLLLGMGGGFLDLFGSSDQPPAPAAGSASNGTKKKKRKKPGQKPEGDTPPVVNEQARRRQEEEAHRHARKIEELKRLYNTAGRTSTTDSASTLVPEKKKKKRSKEGGPEREAAVEAAAPQPRHERPAAQEEEWQHVPYTRFKVFKKTGFEVKSEGAFDAFAASSEPSSPTAPCPAHIPPAAPSADPVDTPLLFPPLPLPNEPLSYAASVARANQPREASRPLQPQSKSLPRRPAQQEQPPPPRLFDVVAPGGSARSMYDLFQQQPPLPEPRPHASERGAEDSDDHARTRRRVLADGPVKRQFLPEVKQLRAQIAAIEDMEARWKKGRLTLNANQISQIATKKQLANRLADLETR
eukprot:g29026.t1